MKKYTYPLLISIAILLLAGLAKAQLSCSIATSCSGGVVPFSLDTTTATGGSHVAQGSGYPEKVCCTGIASLGTSCSGNYETLIKLYKNTNSHAAKALAPTTDPSDINICLSAGVTDILDCDYVTGQTCQAAGYDTCLATMKKDTNSHMTDCSTDPYGIQICCGVALCTCTDSTRTCTTTEASCGCDGDVYKCESDVDQTCENTCDVTGCSNCAPPQCARLPVLTGDYDGDGIDNKCETETSFEDCNDGKDNDGNGFCDDFGCTCTATDNYCGTGNSAITSLPKEDACIEQCPACLQCGAGFFNFCDQQECPTCGATCLYIPTIGQTIGTCCPDADGDGICDADDDCAGFDDADDADGDGIPDGCDICPPESGCNGQDCSQDFDNDCSDDDKDCWDDDPALKEGDFSGIQIPCGADGCYTHPTASDPLKNLTYYPCNEQCINGVFECLSNCLDPEVKALPDVDIDGIVDDCDTESDSVSCSDGIDNDGDGLVDFADNGCSEFCPSCRECGTGFWNVCGPDECDACGQCRHYVLFNCCPDADGDGFCDDEDDKCLGGNDNDDMDGDLIPDVCDKDCQPGETICDGVCASSCPDPDCGDETICEWSDSCGCAECDNQQGNCDQDLRCDVSSQTCVGQGGCLPGTTLCGDGYCRTDCQGNEASCDDADDVCTSDEGCNCADCAGQEDPCATGSRCDSSTELCTDEDADDTKDLCEQIPDAVWFNATCCGDDGMDDTFFNESCACIEGSFYCDPDSNREYCNFLGEEITGTNAGICDNAGEVYCWETDLGQCCGDDPVETREYTSNTIIDDILVNESCFGSSWTDRQNEAFTLYSIASIIV